MGKRKKSPEISFRRLSSGETVGSIVQIQQQNPITDYTYNGIWKRDTIKVQIKFI